MEHNLELLLLAVGTVTFLFSPWLGPERLISDQLMESALTPIGEPLSTIAVVKLRGGALDGDLTMLMQIFGVYIVAGFLLISIAGGFFRWVSLSPVAC